MRLTSSRFEKKREYTDKAILIGPNIQWAGNAYDDLTRIRPEVLLGYHVSIRSAVRGGLRGVNPGKIVLIEGPWSWRDWKDVLEGAWSCAHRGTKVEMWAVHHLDGCFQIDYSFGGHL